MNVLDIFSGIGGFSLGLERAGMRTVAFCEIDPYCHAVLRKHWPGVPIFEDIRLLHAADVPAGVDVICGGFPCQDISAAGKRAGIEGERSGLWSEFARLIGGIRPRYAIVENVSALLGRGLSRVLGDLAEIGYDAEWHCIPASAVGAPHQRDRVWIIAYAFGERREQGWRAEAGRAPWDFSQGDCAARSSGIMADTSPQHDGLCSPGAMQRQESKPGNGCVSSDVADTQSAKRQSQRPVSDWRQSRFANGSEDVANTERNGRQQSAQVFCQRQSFATLCGEAIRDAREWLPEPDVGRVAHGVPSRVDRLKSLGNAVVPQIPEILGKAIMRLEQ